MHRLTSTARPFSMALNRLAYLARGTTATMGFAAWMLASSAVTAQDRVVVEGIGWKPVGGVSYDSARVQDSVLPPGMAGSGGPINSGFDRLVNKTVTQGGGNGRQAPSSCASEAGGG